MSLSTDQSDPERVEYHDWLLRIQDQQLRQELLDIVSKLFLYSQGSLKSFLDNCSFDNDAYTIIQRRVMVFLSCKSIPTIGHPLDISLFFKIL